MCECLQNRLLTLSNTMKLKHSVDTLHVSWSDEALNLEGASATAVYKTSSSASLEQLKSEKFFVEFSFCPFCGENFKAPKRELTEDEIKKLQDEEAYKIFSQLEDDLEDKFNNITVRDLGEAYETAYTILEHVDLEFTLTKYNEENRMQITHKGHFEDSSIELILVADEDEENIYTVTVF